MRNPRALIVPAVLLAACGGATGSALPKPGPPGGTPALAVRPVIVDATSVRQAVDAGKPTVLLFMATGCTSCAAQASALASAASGRGVQLVGVDISSADAPGDDLRAFLNDAELSGLPFTWTIDRDQNLDQRYQVQALDETVGLAGGVVRFHNTSAADATQLRRQIAGLR